MSDIIYTPPASSGGTTINPTNNRIPKRQNATTFADSVLENGTNYLYSNYGGYTGLGLDFANFVSYLGDWNNLINGTSFVVNDATQTIYTLNNGVNNGLIFDFNLSTYRLGDIGTNSTLIIDSNNQYLQLLINSNQYFFADNTTLTTKTGAIYTLTTDNSGIYTDSGGTIKGFKTDFTTQITQLGDFNGTNFNNYITIDDSQGLITLNSSGSGLGPVKGLELNYSRIYFNGPTQPTASGPADHLEVVVNGTTYLIQLLNP